MSQLPNQRSEDSAQLVCVAKIGRPHGTAGELRVWPLDPGSQSLIGQDEVFIGDSPDSEDVTSHGVRRCRTGTRHLILSIKGVKWRNQAEALKDKFIFIRSSDLPELTEDEYYLYELKGLEVYGVDGDLIGVVDDMIETGAAETLIIREDSGTLVMVPFVEKIVIDVDLEDRRITLNPPEGLLDITRAPGGGQG